MKYVILATEGPHDQAAIGRLLKLMGLKDFAREFGGELASLESFWRGFVPTSPPLKLYERSSMPSIFSSSAHSISVAIYQGEGSNLIPNLIATISNYRLGKRRPYIQDIYAFGLIMDADTHDPDALAKDRADQLRVLYPTISAVPGTITEGIPRTGIYVLPDNKRQGTLDSILVDCASVVFHDHRSGAEQFLNGLADDHKRHWRRPFGEQKALVASIVSVLRPGMANTPSIAQDRWICGETVQTVAELDSLYQFIKTLLDLPVPVG